MTITGSSDINNLSIKVIYDLSGVTPIIYLENQSTGPNLSGVSYYFSITSPTQTPIKEANLNVPDITGVWSNFTIGNPWPRPFNQIEWSGAPYSAQVVIKDSAGNIYTNPVQYTSICRPFGNLSTSKNTYGKGSTLVQVKCEEGRIYFQDTTNASYQGRIGVIGSSVLRVNFPMDDTGFVPDPFIGANFSTALVPITYSGKGYQFLSTSIYEYDMGDDTFVRIKYLISDTFGVWCNIDLMPLLCEYQKLINSIETGNCANVEEANKLLTIINPKFNLVVMGMFQPLLGIDVPALIEEIKVIGGFDCDCCNSATGIIPVNSSIIDGYNFSVVTLGGDIQGSFIQNGNNIQLELSDIKYIFKICDQSPASSEAFTVTPSLNTGSFTKTYCLNVDLEILSQEILTTISSSSALVNLFNSIVISGEQGGFNLIVDGGCIFNNSASCDYTFTMTGIPLNTTFAILSSIQIGNNTINSNFSFNIASISALQTYLNTLGIGVFSVTNPVGSTVLISSNTNPNNIVQILYKNPAVNVAAMTKDCTGYVPLTANQVVQNIINYLCSLNDSNIITSSSYEICYIDPLTQTQKITNVQSGVSLSYFISELLNRGCQTIDYIISLGSVNCARIKSVFGTASNNAMLPNDYFLATKVGACAPISPVEAFLTMLTYGSSNASVLSAFCDMVNLCGGGNPCAPYDVFYAEVVSGSPSSDLIVTFSHPDAVSNTIRYARIDNTTTPTYITIPGILPGASPYSITPIDNGQYRVYIRPVYADGRLCSETSYDTMACPIINAFSASYDGTNINVAYTAEISVPAVRVTVNYPNGGYANYIYSNGDPIVIAPPINVFGTFQISIQSICDISTSFYSTPSSPSSVVIQQNNSSILNIAGENKLLAVTADGVGVFNSAFIADGATSSFFFPDGFYGNVIVGASFPVGDFIISLATNGTTYYAVKTGAASYSFYNLTVLNGVQIVVSPDTSPAGAVFEINNMAVSGLTVNYVTPGVFTFTSGGFPVLPTTSAIGVHNGFSAQFQVNVTSSGSFNMAIYKNGSLTSIVIPLSSSGTYMFPTTFTALPTDDVELRLYP